VKCGLKKKENQNEKKKEMLCVCSLFF